VVDQTKWPLLGGTLVGLLAFSPIGFSPDNTGEYAGSLFWTITIALLVSWVVAVWLTPYYCSIALRAPTSTLLDETRPAGSPEHPILRAYRAFLGRAIRWRLATIAIVAGVFLSSLAIAPLVPPGFFPPSTRAQFVVDYFLPEGTDIERTARDLRELGGWIRDEEGVTGTNTVVGAGHQRFMLIYSSESPNSAYGQILVDVADYGAIDPLLTRIDDHIAARYPDASPKVWKFVLGPGGGPKIEARFTGPDATELRRLAEEARAVFAEAGAIGVKDDWRGMVQVIRPRVDEAKARRLGLTQADVSRAIEERFTGTRIGIYREADDLLPIVMRPAEADRLDAAQIRDVQVFSPVLQRYVPITQAVDGFDTVFENSRIRRLDRALAITAQADPAPGVLSGDLFEDVRPLVEAIELPPGYTLEWRGEYGSSQDANAGLAATMPIGFGAMILVVFFLFNAVRQPLIIWLTVPLAAIGVVYGLVLFDTPLEFMAILGALALTGMLIKNAIILIDEADTQIREARPRMSAVTDAAVSRVRPVSLGVITTVLGVVPLLWDPFFRSLAVVIICGLTFATVLTLVIVPVLYATFFRIREDERDGPPASAAPAHVAATPA
jgi:multidrug efflux pump subunit AcrB